MRFLRVDIVANVPVDVPDDALIDVPDEAPIKMSLMDMPADADINVPIDMPVEVLAEVPAEVRVDMRVDTWVEGVAVLVDIVFIVVARRAAGRRPHAGGDKAMVCFLLARRRDERVGVEVFGDAWILPGDRKKRSALSSESESLALGP